MIFASLGGQTTDPRQSGTSAAGPVVATTGPLTAGDDDLREVLRLFDLSEWSSEAIIVLQGLYNLGQNSGTS